MPNTPARTFGLGDVLSVSTGILVSPRGAEALYDVMDFVTGDSLTTIGLAAMQATCSAELVRQHPQLGAVDASGVNGSNWREFLAAQIATLGETLDVVPMENVRRRGLADDLDYIAERV